MFHSVAGVFGSLEVICSAYCRNLNYGRIVSQKINRKKQWDFSMLSKGKAREYWMSLFQGPPQEALVMLMICILCLTLKSIMLFLLRLLIYCIKPGT